jgi:hypothetical protein
MLRFGKKIAKKMTVLTCPLPPLKKNKSSN